jgi:hypothetical protein
MAGLPLCSGASEVTPTYFRSPARSLAIRTHFCGLVSLAVHAGLRGLVSWSS